MNDAVIAALSEHQQNVARALLAEESAKRRHMVMALSGSHAYGFPSPDSDLDLKAIHIEPTRRLLGLGKAHQAAARLEVIDEVEIDYTSNELQPVLAGILGGNGNYIERVLGRLLVHETEQNDTLAELVRGSLSQNVYQHYRGFANSQFRGVQNQETTTAKKVLYVMRTALTGTHLLNTGELVVDLNENLDTYDFDDARELIEYKLNGERVQLSVEQTEHWRSRLKDAFELLETARRESKLPAQPANADAVEAWLIETRRADLG